jgi:large subunit ribosomal protein L22
MKAILRHLRVSPLKANLVAALVRGKKAVDAVDILKFTPKKTARPLMKLIQSAIANAETNFKQDKQDLYVKEIVVTKGATYKRSVPVSRGRANPILKRTTHMTVKLAVKATEAKASKKEEKVATPETKKVTKKASTKKSK